MTEDETKMALNEAHGQINAIIRRLHQRVNAVVDIELGLYPYQTFQNGSVNSEAQNLQPYVSSLSVSVKTDMQIADDVPG